MDKKIKLSIISASVIAGLGVAGGVYYRIDQLQQKRDYFQSQFDKTKAMLPKAIVIDKTSESSLFETNSKYTIQIVKGGQKTSSKLVITSHLEHGLSYFVSGVIEGTATGKIEGPFTKEFKSMDKLFDSQIKILSDDTLITNTKFSDLIAKDGTEIKGITSYLEATRNDDSLKTNFKIASLSSPKSPEGQSLFNLKDLNLEYSGKSNQIGNNHFAFKVGSVDSPFIQVKGINLSADSKVHSGLFDLTSSMNVSKINAAKWKDGSIDFKYSILGFDEASMKTLYTIGQKTAPTNEEDIQKGISAMEEQVKKIFTRGLQFNLDKLSFKSGDDNFNFSFKSSLPQSSTFEDVSFEKNLQASYHLQTKGSLSNLMAQQINQKLESMNVNSPVPAEQQIAVANDSLNVDFEINHGHGLLNGKDLTSDQQDVLHIILSTIDEKLHSKEAFTKDSSSSTSSTTLNPVNDSAKNDSSKVDKNPTVNTENIKK